MLISPKLVSRHEMVIVFECAKKIRNLLFPLFFYCSLLFVNKRTIGILKVHKGKLITIFFFIFLDFTHQKEHADQFSGPPSHFYRNYGPLFIEPKLAKMTSFWPKMTS